MNREDVSVPPAACPHCGYAMDSATAAGKEPVRPKPGDVSVCLRCAGVLEFDDGLVLRALTDGALDELPEDVRMEIYRVRVAIRQLWRSEEAWRK